MTDVVRQLVEGKEYGFSQRGEAALKGFEEAVLRRLADDIRSWLVRTFESALASG